MSNDSYSAKRSILKRYLPASLFWRAFLILVVPIILLQGIAVYVFYVQHWGRLERHLSLSLTNDIAFLVHEIERVPAAQRAEVQKRARQFLDIDVRKEPYDPKDKNFPRASSDPVFDAFVRQFGQVVEEPFWISRSRDDGENRAVLRIRMDDSVMRVQFSLKRLTSVTVEVFFWWMAGSTLVLGIIATLFLRNQIRPITKLSEAAEQFGKGIDTQEYRPQGALEVRKAGYSFLAMRDRLKRMISARTEMLAAISHDLRTPLTRMRLALAMLPEQKYAKPLLADVQDMEKMIQEYLDFAKGGGGEPMLRIRLTALLAEVAGKYARQGKEIPFACTSAEDPEISIFHNAMRRCLYNLIDNALRFGTQCQLQGRKIAGYAEITVEDNGPGIPEEMRDIALQPFKRLDASRDPNNSGSGLGLSIVQDIVHRHGGYMTLEDATMGGLRVRIRLPL